MTEPTDIEPMRSGPTTDEASATPDTNDVPEVPPFAGEPGSSTDPGSDAEEVSFAGEKTSSEGELAGSGLGDAPTGVPQEAT